MVTGTLTMALDYRKDKSVPHQIRSRLVDGIWWVCKSGPGYSNTYRITDFDAEGEEWLKAHEEK